MHTVKPRELLTTRGVCAARRVGGRWHGHARVRARVPWEALLRRPNLSCSSAGCEMVDLHMLNDSETYD